MTMTITLDEQTSGRLQQIADENNMEDINHVVSLLLRDAVWSGEIEGEAPSTPEQEAALDTAIEEGLTDITADHVTSLEQATAKVREKHGFPTSWPLATGANPVLRL